MQESLPVFNSMSEIAEYLGITKVSVSLALKNSPLISDELRKQVQQLARATGFSPRKYRKQPLHRKGFCTTFVALMA